MEPEPRTDELSRHVVTHFKKHTAQWEQLRAHVSEAEATPIEAKPAIHALKKMKSLRPRSVRRDLAKLRKRYRKSYRRTAEQMIKGWLPNYESRLAKARPYQRDIARITKDEIRTMQRVHGVLKKTVALCERIRRSVGRQR